MTPNDTNVSAEAHDGIRITPRKPSLIAGPALYLLPSFAQEFSINHALVLQQLYYWTKKTFLKNREGRPAIKYTYGDWQKQFPFWTSRWLKQLLGNIELNGWICVERGTAYNTYSMNPLCLSEFEGLGFFGNKLLVPSESPIKVFPAIVCSIGMVEAIVLQTIHIRTYKQPNWWVKKTMREWQDELLPFVSLRSLERAFAKLEAMRVVEVAGATNKGRKSKQVRVNYEELAQLLPAKIEIAPPKVHKRAAKSSDSSASSVHLPANASGSSAISSPSV